MIDDLLKNVQEFLDSGEDNLKKKRFNASVADYFKAIVILCDALIYREMRTLPKNHNDRFRLLDLYFKGIYDEISSLFKIYIDSYNLRLSFEDSNKLKNYANELKNLIDKKRI